MLSLIIESVLLCDLSLREPFAAWSADGRLFENIFIARALSNDDLDVGPFEWACMVVAIEPDDSEDSLDRGGRDAV
jgi:hypothetical protein